MMSHFYQRTFSQEVASIQKEEERRRREEEEENNEDEIKKR